MKNAIENWFNKWGVLVGKARGKSYEIDERRCIDELIKELNAIAIPKDEIIEGLVFENGLIVISPDTLAKDYISKDMVSKACLPETMIKHPENYIEKEVLREKVDDLLKKKVKDFGISMAGKYRCQGCAEFYRELRELLNSEGEEVMVCSIEGCGKVDKSHTAYCVRHGRSPHRMEKVKKNEEKKA